MDTINDNLSLTVINDGDGTQCGYNYKTRCILFATQNSEQNKARDAMRMVCRADEWMQKRGYKGETALVLLAQAYDVMDYYAEHVTQLVGVSHA